MQSHPFMLCYNVNTAAKLSALQQKVAYEPHSRPFQPLAASIPGRDFSVMSQQAARTKTRELWDEIDLKRKQHFCNMLLKEI